MRCRKSEVEWRIDQVNRIAQLPPLDSLADSTLLDTKTTATYLGMPPKTVANWRLGKSPIPYVKIGQAVRYRAGDLKAIACRPGQHAA
jgi:hypothetical protein